MICPDTARFQGDHVMAKFGSGFQMSVVLDHIELHLDFNTQVSCLAMLVGLSSSYFTRVFKLRAGMGPAHYVRVRRIERAKRMMRESRNSLAQIAVACGFSDQPHLSRLFRRHVGVTPGEWRRCHCQTSSPDARGV
jgi:AraC family transcriptional regulator